MTTKKELEKWAEDNINVNFIETKKGRLVVFNPDRFIWNAYGKDSFDIGNLLSDQEWINFSQQDIYPELDDFCYNQYSGYCKINKLGDYKDEL